MVINEYKYTYTYVYLHSLITIVISVIHDATHQGSEYKDVNACIRRNQSQQLTLELMQH